MGRFLRAYPGYTAEMALAMPWSRWRVLLAAIPALEAEEDLRALLIAGVGANPGEKGQAFRDLRQQFIQSAGFTVEQTAGKKRAVDGMQPGLTPGVTVLPDEAETLAELRAKRAAWQAERERQRAASPK